MIAIRVADYAVAKLKERAKAKGLGDNLIDYSVTSTILFRLLRPLRILTWL